MVLRTILVAATCALTLSSAAALADLAISANDGKQVRAARWPAHDADAR